MRFLFLLFFPTIVFAETAPAVDFPAVATFIDEMVEKYDFEKEELNVLFSQIALPVAPKITKPEKTEKPKKKKTPMSWEKYQQLFITEKRVADGVEFWHNNEKMLAAARQKFNIPSEIIVSIIGVESDYGNKKGEHPVLATLTKYSFGNYRRRNFYRRQLASFLRVARKNHLAPLAVSGSWAGAMGFAQFIPTSYEHYAVDFDNDGAVDFFKNPNDSIGSVANYLAKHDWRKNAPVAVQTENANHLLKYANNKSLKPQKTAEEWRALGVFVDPEIHHSEKMALRIFGAEYWFTLWNFYVLTRYNHDSKYALVVHRLAQKISEQIKK